MTIESTPSRELLGESGPLAEALPGFAPREEQIRLAEAIEESLDNGGSLVAEAGTGTGKTIAYLAPILQSGKRAIISTGTKTLQDQLFFRDLPGLIGDPIGQPKLNRAQTELRCVGHVANRIASVRTTRC